MRYVWVEDTVVVVRQFELYCVLSRRQVVNGYWGFGNPEHVVVAVDENMYVASVERVGLTDRLPECEVLEGE